MATLNLMGGSPGRLWEETTHVWQVMGSNPSTIYRMDITFFRIDLLLNLYCLLEKTEYKPKRGRGGHSFKKTI